MLRKVIFPWLVQWVIASLRIGIGLSLIGAVVAELIGSFENHLPHELSGGMRQRVALGRLMAYEPHLYLLDEPFGALDSQTKAAMGRELLRVWSGHKASVLFVTHDIEEAVTLSDRVIVFSSRPGRIKLNLAIDLERPRDPIALRRNSRFRDLTERVWASLDHFEI